MNDIVKLIGGLIAITFIVIPLLAFLIVLPYKGYRKLQAKQKAGSPRWALVRLIGTALLVILWGLMTGFVSGIISQIFPIVFVYPIVMGINSGKMIVDAIQRLKLRTTRQMVVLSLLSAVVMYGAYQYCGYLGFQLQASTYIFDGLSEATEEENLGVTKTFLDYALEEETGHSGFVGYVLYKAKQGMSIGRVYSSNRINLGSVMIWLYWLLEFGIILGVTIQKGKNAISRPFCEACGNWYGQEKHLGGTTPANASLLLDLIRQKDFIELEKLVEKNAELPSVEVYFQGCRVCGKSQSQLVVRHAFQTPKGELKFSDASQMVLQPSESAFLLSQPSFSGD